MRSCFDLKFYLSDLARRRVYTFYTYTSILTSTMRHFAVVWFSIVGSLNTQPVNSNELIN